MQFSPQAASLENFGYTLVLIRQKSIIATVTLQQIYAFRIILNVAKVKVKLSLCFNWAPRHEGVLGEWKYSPTHSWPRY
jgi:hypothetical protein